MLATRPPKQPGNHHPTMSSNIMAISVGTSSEEPAPTGVLYIYNALAFSTLLSSQETDAHRCGACHSTSGQPLNLTLVFPSCQLRFSGSFRKMSKPHHGSTRHQKSPSAASLAPAGTRETLGWKLL